jgi:hypothetical protein
MSSTPSSVPPAPAEAPQAKLSAVQRIMGVFTSPGETFADIARVPSWVAPIVLLTIMFCGVSATMMKRVDWNSFLENKMSESSRWESLSAEQKQQQIGMAQKIVPIQTYAIGLLGPLVIVLFIAAVYHFGFNLIRSAGLRFKQSYSIAAHACLVWLVSSPLAIIVMLMKQPGDVDPEHLMATNVGEFLSRDTPKALMKIASSLDIFTIWLLVLLAIGFAAANPKKVSTGAAYGIVFGAWAAKVLVTVIWAVTFG